MPTRLFDFSKRSQSLSAAQRSELAACSNSPAHFLNTHGTVYDATARDWLPFKLWSAQEQVLVDLQQHRLTVIVKARQLGLSWLVTGWALWLMLFRPAATVLFFSKRDQEAVHLVNFRLRGMLDRLPAWLRAATVNGGGEIEIDNAHELRLVNHSAALAFPTTGGRSYTASLAIVDEADFAADLDQLLNAVKPTVDAGGRLILLSTVDKSRPESAFKRIYRAGVAHENGYRSIFLPWGARPGRSESWYAEQRADVLARTGHVDDLFQEYPGTDLEALAPRAADRRFAAQWLAGCDATQAAPVSDAVGLLGHVGLVAWQLPEPGARYVIGADPAEGNPQSDESAASVVCIQPAGATELGEQVAVLAAKLDPAQFAASLDAVAAYYNGASVLVERNNHGHAVLLWLREFGQVRVLNGPDGKPGWLQTGRGKPLAMDNAADMLREGSTKVRDRSTLAQLAAIEGATLAAPAGQHDDRAMAHVLALAAMRFCSPVAGQAAVIEASDPIAEADRGWF